MNRLRREGSSLWDSLVERARGMLPREKCKIELLFPAFKGISVRQVLQLLINTETLKTRRFISMPELYRVFG